MSFVGSVRAQSSSDSSLATNEIRYVANPGWDTEFEGVFEQWNFQELYFPKDEPEKIKATIAIEMNSTKSFNEQVDKLLAGKEYFDVAQYPMAFVRIHHVKALEKQDYQAKATITLKGVQKNIPFTFRLTPIDLTRATVKGEVELSRSKFQITGAGPKEEVKIQFHFTLDYTQP